MLCKLNDLIRLCWGAPMLHLAIDILLSIFTLESRREIDGSLFPNEPK